RATVRVLWQAGQSRGQVGARRLPAAKSCSLPHRGQMPRTRDATSTSRPCLKPAATPMGRKDGTRAKWRPGMKTQPKANAQNTPAALAARLNRPPGEGRVTVTTAGRAEAPNTVSDAGTSREPSPDSSAELTRLAHLPASRARPLAWLEGAVREQALGHEVLLRSPLDVAHPLPIAFE